MKNINVRFLNHEGDNTVAMEIGAAVEAIVKEYLTKKCRPYVGIKPFMFTAKDAQDPEIYTDTANLRALLEQIPDGLVVTLGNELLGGAKLNPQELATVISSAVLAALEKSDIMEGEIVDDEEDELDFETAELFKRIAAFKKTYGISNDSRPLIISKELLQNPVEFLAFVVSLREYLKDLRQLTVEVGVSHIEEVTLVVR